MSIPYDAAAGLSQASINTILEQLFQLGQRTGLFNRQYPVDQVDIDSIDINFNQAPTILLDNNPLSEKFNKALNKTFEKDERLSKLTPSEKAVVLKGVTDTLSQVTFQINVANVTVTINYTAADGEAPPPTKITAAIEVTVAVSIDATPTTPTLSLNALSATITTGDQEIDTILNDSVVRYYLNDLNTTILKPIVIPTLQFAGLQVSLPTLAIEDGFLAVYTSLGTVSPTVPTPYGGWPATDAFVAVDAKLIAAAGNIAISTVSLPSASFNWEILSGSYQVTLSNLYDVNVDQDGSGNLSASISAGANVNLTIGLPWPFPNISFSPGVAGSVSVTLHAAVVNGELGVTIVHIDSIDLSLTWGGLPGWVESIINGLLSPFEDFLINATLTPVINAFLDGYTFNVYHIPTISIPLGPGYTVSVNSVQTGELQPTGEAALIVAHGTPVIS